MHPLKPCSTSRRLRLRLRHGLATARPSRRHRRWVRGHPLGMLHLRGKTWWLPVRGFRDDLGDDFRWGHSQARIFRLLFLLRIASSHTCASAQRYATSCMINISTGQNTLHIRRFCQRNCQNICHMWYVQKDVWTSKSNWHLDGFYILEWLLHISGKFLKQLSLRQSLVRTHTHIYVYTYTHMSMICIYLYILDR